MSGKRAKLLRKTITAPMMNKVMQEYGKKFRKGKGTTHAVIPFRCVFRGIKQEWVKEGGQD